MKGGGNIKRILSYIWQYIKRLDIFLIILVTAACGFGITILYSLSINSQTQTITNATVNASTCKTQIIAALLGICASAVIALLDYRKFSKLWFIYLPLTVGFTLLTFTSLGTSGLDGADDVAWIDLGFMTVQPAEFLKIAFILSMSYHCYKTKDFFNNPLNILGLIAHAAIPTGIVMLQGDDGTAAVFIMIFLVIVFVAGLSWKYILGAAVAAPIAIYFVWNYYLQSVHKNRILSIINPDKYGTEDILYQTNLAKIALGSGQIDGKGLFGGDYSYVPVCHNDFIFSYIGQTLGFIGCIAVVILLGLIMLRIIYNGLRAADDLGKYICLGVFAYLFTHTLLNIGMVIGLTPVIGIPLPFFSAGGSAMLTATVSIGLVLSVYFHQEKFNTLFKK